MASDAGKSLKTKKNPEKNSKTKPANCRKIATVDALDAHGD